MTDFATGAGGDVIELERLADLAGQAHGADLFAAGYLQLVQSGADTHLEFDADAGDSSYDFETVLVFSNTQSASLTPENFSPNNSLNDAPLASNLTQTKGYTEGAPSVALDDIVVSDVDTGETITATLTLANAAAGALTTSGGATYNALSGAWTISGTVAQVNAALQAVAFTPATNNDLTTTITTQIRDAAGAGPVNGTITLNVTPVNDAPDLLPNAPTAVTFTENGSSVQLLPTGAVVDPDAPVSFIGGSLTFAITSGFVAGDQIIFAAPNGLHINAGTLLDGSENPIGTISGYGTGTVTISNLTGFATPALVNQLVQAFGFFANSENPGSGDRVVRVTFNDGGNNGGGVLSDFVDQTVHVVAVNDAPVAVAPASYNATEQTSLNLKGSLSVTDPDSNGGSVTVTLAVTQGF